MADQLFYTYNSGGNSTKALAQSTAHPYSPIFDEGRGSVWANEKEFGAGVYSVNEHYSPISNNSSKIEKDASGGSDATFGTTQLVTGVNIERDAAGHVTNMTVDSIKLPAQTNLSLGSASGEFITNLSVSGHQITATYGSQTDISLGTASGQFITALTVSGTHNHQITATYGSETYLSLGTGTASATNQVVKSITVSNHAITQSYMTIATYEYLAATYQPLGNYQPAGNYAPDSIILTNIKGTYETTGYQIATYHGNSTIASYSVIAPAATTSNFGVMKITSDYHYQPTGNGVAATLSNGSDVGWGGNVITGINIDGKGHIMAVYKGAIPAQPASPGTLNTNNSSTLSVSSSEALSGNISLHKVSKTGKFSDLVDAPTMSDYVTKTDYQTLSIAGSNDNVYGYNIRIADSLSVNLIDTDVYIPPMSTTTFGVAKVGSGVGLVGINASGQLTYTDTHNLHALTVTNGTATAASAGTEITFVESVTGCNATSGDLTASTTRKKITIPDVSGFLTTSTETGLSLSGTKGTANFVTDVKKGTGSHDLIISYGTALTSETSLSLGTGTGSGTAITALSVSGHQITATYTTIPAAANNGKLYVRKDSETGTSIMTANQSTNTYLSFSAGTGIKVEESEGKVTITNTSTNTDYQCTSDGHYSPSSGTVTSTTTGTAVGWSGSVVTGVTRDSKGHVTGVTTGTIPANPGGGSANCVTYTSETNNIRTITRASSPGSDTHTLYVIV